jgi:hypothetical protein
MKILGVGDNKYICEIDVNEMLTIMGVESAYDWEERLQPGKEVDMARTIKAARWIRNLDQKHLDQTIRQLKEVLAGVELVKETAVALNLFNKLAEEQV